MRKVRTSVIVKKTRSSKAKILLAAFSIALIAIILTIPLQGYAENTDAGTPTTPEAVTSADSPGSIVPDGEFHDWVGMPEMADRTENNSPQSDIVMVKWFPDIHTSNLYLYCERLDSTIDKNSNPKAVDWNFQVDFESDSGKMTAFVDYHPESRQVEVDLRDVSGRLLWSGKGKWGEDKYSACKVEFYVPLSYITGYIQSSYQFQLSFSSISDRVPDMGFITVSTASTFPWLTAALFLFWIMLLVFLHRQNLHFFKFIAGSIGLFAFAMILGSAAGEKYLENAVTWCLWLFSQITGGFKVFAGYSLVTVYHDMQAVSYIIDYECSGFIEMLVFLCLLIFYPVFGGRKKALYAVSGTLFIFAANIVRLVFISYSIKVFGTSVFFLSHTVFARVLFFGLMVLLYYYVFTVAHIRKQKVGDLSYD